MSRTWIGRESRGFPQTRSRSAFWKRCQAGEGQTDPGSPAARTGGEAARSFEAGMLRARQGAGIAKLNSPDGLSRGIGRSYKKGPLRTVSKSPCKKPSAGGARCLRDSGCRHSAGRTKPHPNWRGRCRFDRRCRWHRLWSRHSTTYAPRSGRRKNSKRPR